MNSSTLFLPTGADPEKVPSLTFRTPGGTPGIPKWSSPVGSGLPSMVIVPLTLAVGCGSLRELQPQPQRTARPKQIVRHARYIRKSPGMLNREGDGQGVFSGLPLN